MKELTIEIPQEYIENKYIPLGEILQYHINFNNEIVENEKHFIVNGRKYKKLALISMFTDPDSGYGVEQLNLARSLLKTTTGRLFLTKNPAWIRRCSNPKYCSWESCFSPDGCHWLSANIYSKSTSVWMAMITDSEMTKIIGRAFVLIPIVDYDIEKFDNSAYMLKSYGNFPDNYKESVLQFIGKHFYQIEKDDFKIKFPEDDDDYYDDDDEEDLIDKDVAYHHEILRPLGVKSMWIDTIWGYVDRYGKSQKGIKSFMFGNEIVYRQDRTGRLVKSSYVNIDSMIPDNNDDEYFDNTQYGTGYISTIYIVDAPQLKYHSNINGRVDIAMAFDIVKKAISGDENYVELVKKIKMYNCNIDGDGFIEIDNKVIYIGSKSSLGNTIYPDISLSYDINQYIIDQYKERRLNDKSDT